MTQDYKPSLVPLSGTRQTKDLQRRRADPLRDADVRANVALGEELTGLERFLRRVAAQKKTIGGFLIGLGTFVTSAAAFYPEQWLIALAALLGTGGGILMGGGSSMRSDAYEQEKNNLLKQRDLM